MRTFHASSILSLVGARTFRCWCHKTKESRTQRQRKLTYRKSGNNKSRYNAQRSGNLPYQPLKCLPERDICSGRGNWLTFSFQKFPQAKARLMPRDAWCLIAAQHLRRVSYCRNATARLLSSESLGKGVWVYFTFFPFCVVSCFLEVFLCSWVIERWAETIGRGDIQNYIIKHPAKMLVCWVEAVV